tara:strand:+ start:280 stop:6303 length:6024 start_codon:yes stop_codon:yes gene_type:complete
MPIEQNFSNSDLNLVSQGEQLVDISTLTGVYIRVTVYQNRTLVSGINPETNEIFPAVFYSAFPPKYIAAEDYENLTVDKLVIPTHLADITEESQILNNPQELVDFIHLNSDGTSAFIKINELLNFYSIIAGDYEVRIDFLEQFQFPTNNPQAPQGIEKFVVKEVSPSRKEIRLKLKYSNMSTDSISNGIFDAMDTEFGGTDYQFKHVLCSPKHRTNSPIVNYVFDTVTDGRDNQSLILRLYDPVPTGIGVGDILTIEKEIISTQVQRIKYLSEVTSQIDIGSLPPDPDNQQYLYSADISDDFSSYNELSSSTNESLLNLFESGSIYDYPNLNINYNEFENHTFFGSAVEKLKNFRGKIKTLEGYYNDISNSLSGSENSLENGDSSNLISNRTNLFNKIDEEINTFTPYEKFLYFDAQSQTTASAPSIGKNYADDYAINEQVSIYGNNDNFSKFYDKKDGLRGVYQVTASSVNQGNQIYPFSSKRSNKYRFENKPFFGYSGSIYLSFLVKAEDTWDGTGTTTRLKNNSGTRTVDYNNYRVPIKTITSSFISRPEVTGSEWRRYVVVESASYWFPNNSSTDGLGENPDAANIPQQEFEEEDSTVLHILSGSDKVAPYKIKASSGYQNLATVITQSGKLFSGSISPAGGMFHLHWINSDSGDSGGVATSSYFTDVKITLNDPSDVQPFTQMYRTSSTEWTNWYDGMYDSASVFDTENIHSLENNLPSYIQESKEYGDLKKFIDMLGEQYDIVRNHIDGYLTFYKREYKDDATDSGSISDGVVPDNMLPILGQALGWEFINPFTGSLSDYFSGHLSSATDINTIRNNTWRKALNNLLYLYKSKGTINSVNALLNIYGYPSDVLSINEYGSQLAEEGDDLFQGISSINPDPYTPKRPAKIFTDNISNDLSNGLNNRKGIISFTTDKKSLHHYKFDPVSIAQGDRSFGLDWYINNADINTFEFVYKHNKTKNTQTILQSSGSGAQSLWDLRLVPSSDGISSSLQFRLSTGNTGSNISNDLGKSSLSMSTNYVSMSNGEIWNVMLQRTTSSISGSGTQEYRLVTTLQDNDKIKTFSAISMSVSGGLANTYATGGAVMSSSVHGLAYYANQNWSSTGSRHSTSGSNLIVGEKISASLSEIRGWEEVLKVGRFKQHTLNKFSTVGNTLTSSRDSLTYHFKLNEAYVSSSISGSKKTLDIVDANPKGPKSNPTDYSFTITSSNAVSGSSLYGFDIIDRLSMTPKGDGLQKQSNKIFIKPKKKITGNLSPKRQVIEPIEGRNTETPSITTSDKLTMDVSPTDTVDEFIINNVSNIDLSQYYGKPSSIYSASYGDLDKFRKDFFNHHEIKVDINKFTRAYEGVFNESLYRAVEKMIPARSNFTQPSVVVRPNVLERQKIKTHRLTIDSGSPNLGSLQASMNYNEFLSLSSSHEEAKTFEIGFLSDVIHYHTVTSQSAATASITFFSSSTSGSDASLDNVNPDDYHNKTFIISSSEGSGSTYTLKSDATFNISNTPNVGIKNEITVTAIASRLSASIGHSNGHDGKIAIVDWVYFSASSDAFFTSLSESFAVNSDGALVLIQRKAGSSGNHLITGTGASPTYDSASVLGFGGGRDIDYVRKDRTIPRVISQSAMPIFPKSGSFDIPSSISKSFSYQSPTTTSLNIPSLISQSMNITTGSATFLTDVNSLVSYSSSYEKPLTSSFDVPKIISKSLSVTTGSTFETDVNSEISYSSSLSRPYTSSLDIPSMVSQSLSVTTGSTTIFSPLPTYSSSYNPAVSSIIIFSNTGSQVQRTGSDADRINVNAYKTFRNIHDEWGRGDDDLHFIGSGTGSRRDSSDFNSRHIDDRFHFYMIGDTEVMSGSFINSSGNYDMDFSNHVNFYNRQIVDKNKKVNAIGGSDYIKYHSLFGHSSSFTVPPAGEVSGGIIHGRMMGKTRFFTTRSNGEIIYPSNHVSRFANQYSDMQWKGTKNIDPGVFPPFGQEDYSSASFYGINIHPSDGDNQIVVKTGGPKIIDDNNNVIR